MQRPRNHVLGSALLIPFMVGGCSLLRANVTGIAVETATPNEYLVADFDGVTIDNNPIKSKLKPYQEIETKHIVQVDVWEWNWFKFFDYKVLLGPTFGSGDTVTGLLNHSDPVFEVKGVGWVFAWGYWPFVRDRWVSAAATGTTIAIENYAPGHERVYLVKKMSTAPSATVIIRCLATGATFTLTGEGTYADIQVCGDDPVVGGVFTPAASGLTSTLPAAVLDAFLNPAMATALKAGWTE